MPLDTGRSLQSYDVAAMRKHCEKRLQALDADRHSWWQHWRDLSDYILPRRGRFLETPNENQKGRRRNTKIINSAGTIAARTLASGLMAGITSPARPWFKLVTGDDDLDQFAPVKQWLALVERIMLRVIAKSNLYNCLHTSYGEIGTFGTDVILVLEDAETVVHAYTMTAGEYHLANGARLRANTVYRKFMMTAGQVVEAFGPECVSRTVKNLIESGASDREVEIVHAIEPNARHHPDYADNLRMPFRSVYYERGSDHDKMLGVSGFNEFPGAASRWERTGTDVYGRSPGMDALPDVQSLQLLERRKAQAIDKMSNPPIVVPAGMKNEPVSGLPGGITYAAGEATGSQARPLYLVDPKVNELRQDIREKEAQVRSAYYADLFLMVSMSDRREVTAREIEEKHGEKLIMLGPMLDAQHNEKLDPIVTRVFSICARRGLFPPAPEEVQSRQLGIEYTSLLAAAQKAVGTTAIERLYGFTGSLYAVYPEAKDKLDVDTTIDKYADMLGVDPAIVVPTEKAMAARQARAQQAAAQQAMATLPQVADSAKVLSETETGAGQNALQQIAGGVL